MDLLLSLIFLQVNRHSPTMLDGLSLEKIFYAAVVLVVAYVLVRFTDRGLDGLARRAPRVRVVVKMLAPAFRFSIWFVTAAIILFSIIAPTREPMLALLASVGVALGFGAQDLVKNVLGGFVILVDRPYQLGDRVRIGQAFGEVDQIGLRSTKLSAPDGTRVTIPNSDILCGTAWRASSGTLDSLVVTELFLPHDTDPAKALDIAQDAACSSPYILLTKPVTVHLTDKFQDGPYLLLQIRAYVHDHHFEKAMQTDITMRAKSEFLKRGMLRWNHEHAASASSLR
jgi:small-conductance mechanosensitive channel